MNTHKRFLVIEDNPGCEMILERVLLSVDPSAKVESYESAEKVEAALKKAGSNPHPYDLIIADIFLSGKTTGIELWDRFKEEFPTTPMLIISSLPMDRFFEAIGRNTIAPAFLAKPFGATECRRMIEGLLAYH